jgi:hypothetical protein
VAIAITIEDKLNSSLAGSSPMFGALLFDEIKLKRLRKEKEVL